MQSNNEFLADVNFCHHAGNGRLIREHCIVGYSISCRVLCFILHILPNVVGHPNVCIKCAVNIQT